SRRVYVVTTRYVPARTSTPVPVRKPGAPGTTVTNDPPSARSMPYVPAVVPPSDIDTGSTSSRSIASADGAPPAAGNDTSSRCSLAPVTSTANVVATSAASAA